MEPGEDFSYYGVKGLKWSYISPNERRMINEINESFELEMSYQKRLKEDLQRFERQNHFAEQLLQHYQTQYLSVQEALDEPSLLERLNDSWIFQAIAQESRRACLGIATAFAWVWWTNNILITPSPSSLIDEISIVVQAILAYIMSVCFVVFVKLEVLETKEE